MPKQEQKQKVTKENQEEKNDEATKSLVNEELNEDVDGILAEIDEALGDLTETEVIAFVSGFVQKGGQ